MTSHIVAIGGGGFSDAEGLTPIDRFVLTLADRPRPKVCFVPTASGDSITYRLSFYREFARHADCSDLSLFGVPDDSIEEFVLEQDVIYVGGGNTANMLAIWKLHGVDRALRAAWERGVVGAGISAGAMCWFEAGHTDSFGPAIAPLRDAIGLLRGAMCPHYDQPDRRARFHEALLQMGTDGVGVDDGAALHYEGTTLVKAVRERSQACAYEVHRSGADVAETPLDMRDLPTPAPLR